MNALTPDNPKHKMILDCLMTEPKLDAQPDIFIQVTVPNEFQRHGKFNIGITAGIETTIASAPWIEGCNNMDLILTSSEHSKNVLKDSAWSRTNKQTGQPEGEVQLTKPIEVLFEGVDLETYFPTTEIHKSVDDELKSIPEQFCFLFVGHWLNGDFGEDRKNVSGLIKVFLESFKNKASHNKPALILKTSSADFSALDRDAIVSKIEKIMKTCGAGNLPNVYVLHGDLSDEEMNSLYNHPKIKAHVSFTKGEGYGRPLAEASVSHKPVIASNWSGHIDFLKEAILLPGELKNVHPSAAWENVILQESQWFSVDFGYASAAMRQLVDDNKWYKECVRMAKKQSGVITKEFGLEAMSTLLVDLIEQYVPKQMQLTLPKLKKISL
jgi:hypothetical protein